MSVTRTGGSQGSGLVGIKEEVKMPRASAIVPCADCQEMFPRKLLNRMGRCQGCASKAALEDVSQLHNRSGPYYEKWKAAIKAKIGRL